MPTILCKCGEVYHASDEHIGKQIKCGKCGRLNEIVAGPAEPSKGGGKKSERSAEPNFQWERTSKTPPPETPVWKIHWQDPPRQDPRAQRTPPSWNMPPQYQSRPEHQGTSYRDDAPRRAEPQAGGDYDADPEGDRGRSPPPARWDPSKGMHPMTRRILLYSAGVLFLLFFVLLLSVFGGARAKRDEGPPTAEP